MVKLNCPKVHIHCISHWLQVLSQLPSLHQLNLRGCPIADVPDYQAQLLQQLPMLDVLDSKKVPKSGSLRSAKPAAATIQPRPKQSVGSQALDKPHVLSDDILDGSHVKSQKRPLGYQVAESGAPKLKKARKESLAASTDGVGVADGKGATAPRFDETQSGGDDAEVVKELGKPEKERKGKAGNKLQQQTPAAGSSRSFLADVLDPAKSGPAAKLAAKAERQQMSVADATAAAAGDDARASGLVKVVDVQRGTKIKKAKHGKIGENKSEGNKANGVSGSSAAELLQNGLGLDALQVGLGGSGAWD